MKFRPNRVCAIAVALSVVAFSIAIVSSAAAAELTIDCSAKLGKFKPLHGVNGGPLNYGETVDLSKYWREAAIPSARLHDCEWPTYSVAEMHAMFPSLKADPEKPESYDFRRTDDYLKALTATGAGIVFRLGESIEHSPRKHFVHPPADMDRWAAACLGVIRHYNHGWADGQRYGIKYWEIWNEPENRPVMWTGSDADYYRLYATAAKAIKAKHPELLVGGPAVGAVGDVTGGVWKPTEFLEGFLRECREKKLPLDFFSWHTYTNEPGVYRRKAEAIRRRLDADGFKKCELHLNEWNYLPDNDWSGTSIKTDADARERWYERMGGAEGAAFLAAVLIDLQDSPVDVANVFSGESGPFGLFTRTGKPKKNYFALRAFKHLLDAPQRVKATGGDGKLYVAAGVAADEKSVTVLVSNFNHGDAKHVVKPLGLPWKGATRVEVLLLDEKHDLKPLAAREEASAPSNVELALPAKSVAVVRLTQIEAK